MLLGGTPDNSRLPTEPEQTPEALEAAEEIEAILNDPVARWRAETLAQNGMIPHQARVLALDRRVDTRWVIDHLLLKGCDPATAFDIVSY